MGWVEGIPSIEHRKSSIVQVPLIENDMYISILQIPSLENSQKLGEIFEHYTFPE